MISLIIRNLHIYAGFMCKLEEFTERKERSFDDDDIGYILREMIIY